MDNTLTLSQQIFNDCSSIYFFPAPILDLAQNDFVQSKVEEAAKLFYNNANVTINLVPALVGGGLLLILLVPLLALLFQPAEAGASGYGAPAAEYGAPAPAYGAPEYRSVGNSNSSNHSLRVLQYHFVDIQSGGFS